MNAREQLEWSRAKLSAAMQPQSLRVEVSVLHDGGVDGALHAELDCLTRDQWVRVLAKLSQLTAKAMTAATGSICRWTGEDPRALAEEIVRLAGDLPRGSEMLIEREPQ